MTEYTSKVDSWVIVVMVIAGVVAVLALAPALMEGGLLIPLLPLGLLIGFVMWLFATTRYVLSDSELVVRAGPFRWKIPLIEITAITPSRNPLASPALSLDRLRIEYGRSRFLMISPQNKEAFLTDIDRRQKILR